MTLRDPYQSGAVDAVIESFKRYDSVLVELPTGTGKTVVLAAVIERWINEHGGRALVLAHRRELVEQAAEKVGHWTNLSVGVEMADQKSDNGIWKRPSVVCASIQTMIADGFGAKRMESFRPDQFSIVVLDECHHAVSDTYREVIEYFTSHGAHVLGVTATTDRADEKALGRVFEWVAYQYGVVDAINDGWLVPIRQESVFVEGLDYSGVKVTAGDLNQAELEKILAYERNLHATVKPMLEKVGDKKTLVFAVSVAHAERMSEVLNRYKPACSEWVCGKTPRARRAEILGDFRDGKKQILVNVGVLTEGYDEPTVEVVALARPTKSRALYAQMVGRGTRPLPGVVDGTEDRKAAIAASGKAGVLVLDFVGNAGQHKLISTADVLGGTMDDATRAIVEKKMIEGEVDVLEAIEEAAEEAIKAAEAARLKEQSRRAGLTAKVRFKSKHVDPFNLFDIAPPREQVIDKGRSPTPKMEAILRKNGLDPDVLTYAESRNLVKEIVDRSNRNLCSYKQAKFLSTKGYDTSNITFEQARRIFLAVKGNSWMRLPKNHALSPTSMAGTGHQATPR